ncbi:PLP-dependent transferase [Sulfidibacter corallicola]|uniref:PLP-dependent transferase n=1 Tax=Sulfidibacter corallicola TaxID=2818388 RepID=A0A8A4TGQ7_SULCO|nr:PLP-dependent transferase [Sulfidibacter corallicola]QTD48823.1 PLP-dependent transferase [Sulfidibacter corallicola]
MSQQAHDFETQLIHAGEPRPGILGSVAMPIFQTSTFEDPHEHDYNAIRYTRLSNNPNQLALHDKLAALAGAEAALVSASGMATISNLLLSLLSPGDHLLMQNCVYGGTHTLITHELARFGITHQFIDAGDPASWPQPIPPKTRMIYVESMSNPLLEIPDFEAVVAYARKHGLLSVIDNTFASPYNFQPIPLGFDLEVHSATKYLNGHSDVIAGACMGSARLIETLLHKQNHFGGSLDPHAAFLLLRGLKTLAVRLTHQNATALEVAGYLDGHPALASVNYPGLEHHPRHRMAARHFRGFGGIVSFELKAGSDAARRLIDLLDLILFAPSLGGTESLIVKPATVVQSGLDAAERNAAGVGEGLLRFSTGLESSADLIADLKQALEKI